jgi:hypothetical protein
MNVNDERISRWAAFGRKNAPDSLRIECIGPQPINGFRRERHKLPAPNQIGSLINDSGIDLLWIDTNDRHRIEIPGKT